MKKTKSNRKGKEEKKKKQIQNELTKTKTWFVKPTKNRECFEIICTTNTFSGQEKPRKNWIQSKCEKICRVIVCAVCRCILIPFLFTLHTDSCTLSLSYSSLLTRSRTNTEQFICASLSRRFWAFLFSLVFFFLFSFWLVILFFFSFRFGRCALGVRLIRLCMHWMS